MLKFVKFKKDYRCFKEGQRFDFDKVTLLVGDQGCGKSSLLQLIYNKSRNREEILEIEIEDPDKTIQINYMNFESNPLRKPGSFANDHSTMMAQLASMWRSHGQTTNTVLARLDEFKEGSLILMDEPDMALSPRSAIILARKLENFENTSYQVIVSCHNPWIIETFDRVLSLEHDSWINGKKFLKLHRLA